MRNLKLMTFQTKLATAYSLAVVILCAMCVVSYCNATKIEETRQWGRHSSAVLHRNEALAENLARLEEISFEYAGTSDPQALASLDVARTGALSAAHDLRSLTADNLSQQQRLGLLDPKLVRYLGLLREAIVSPAIATAAGNAHAPATVRAFLPERAALSHDISDLIQQINAEEDRLSLVRRQAIDEALRRSSGYLAFGYASAIFLSVVCILILRGEMRHRAAIQNELEKAQVSLEHRVHERTEDLRAANLALQAQIEERKRAERQVQQLNASLEIRVEERTAELTQVVNELDSFCYTVSHDLRAPLRHVDGFSRILESEFGAELSDEARRHLRRIVQAVNRMGRLIDDLLDLSRIGRKKLIRRRVSVQDLVERSVANYRDSPDGRGVEWRIDPLPDFDCDPGLLEVVYANLIANAVKFTRGLPHRVIQFGALDTSSPATLFVRDNGVGFDPKYADKLFGAFQRLHPEDDFEGTGIGLATVQRIVLRHGGSIRAESQPGSGATFYFTLGAQTEGALARKLEEVKHVGV